jgi:hypothetical protein
MTAKVAPKAKVKVKADTVALTVKVDEKTYVRLSTLRAQERLTMQDILAAAIKSYLAAS